ncbi:hypothetical protein F5Y09DRAFT_295151 [Xylaria sp. FL1042]|nr:hypothetical protein F5Y09DRAFT_295151 [Xylaria sp. FL1042]
MKTVLAFLSCSAAALAASIPAQDASTQTFATGAWRTDDTEIIFLGPPINANGGKFYVNKPTATYCPLDDCSGFEGKDTTFVIGTDSTTMSLDVSVPGGQQVYIAPDGTLSFTQAHSAYIPPGSIVTGFSRNASQETGAPFYLYSDLASWYLCPVTEGEPTTKVYQIYASDQDIVGCYDTRIRTYAPAEENVWEYT